MIESGQRTFSTAISRAKIIIDLKRKNAIYLNGFIAFLFVLLIILNFFVIEKKLLIFNDGFGKIIFKYFKRGKKFDKRKLRRKVY